ncbi:hypothetical protein CAPTEDRAFT_185308 [Capitella teleta]|uniref:Uncharacterized protein n=1 Tax=Capitella teleta TaxID=283909 RepID=R7UJB5_CAPTE|nr:hypothetical protein CAPTEDRAFT_185308 [Capitella teleta]|eukprot:ELU06300.1 hypothetical protein CAPTEDRAFT_185308 [Capitella teleta]
MAFDNHKLISNILLYIVLVAALCVSCTQAVTTCDPMQGYPPFCPQLGEPANRTKCCRHGYLPACCEERSTKICAKTPSGRSTGVYNPDWNLVFCPQPGQPDSYTACCYRGSNVSCCDMKLLAAILGGVFGSIALIGLIVGVTLCVVCRYKIKKGDWICLQIRPGKYKLVTRATMERIQQQQQQRQQQQQPAGGLAFNYNAQPGGENNVAYSTASAG